MSFAERHDPFPVHPDYAGIYAHAVEVPANARVLQVSGQVGVSQDGWLPADFDGQFEQAVQNLLTVLASANMSAADVTKLTIFLTRPEDIPRAALIRRRHFNGVRPAITTVIVAALVSPDWLCEIEAAAASASSG